MSDEFAGATILDTIAAKVIYEQKDPVGLVERVVCLVRAVNDIDYSVWDAFWDHVETEGRIKDAHYSPGKTSASGPGMELFQNAGTRTEAWSQLISGMFIFLAAADKRVINVHVETKKVFATRDAWHDLWQTVLGDRKLKDCEEWVWRFKTAMGKLARIQDKLEGRLVVMPTVYQPCEMALACMHPEFKEKFVLAVAARAAQNKRVKMYEGVPDVTNFKEMQALMREARVFWDDDAEKCGRVTAKRAGDKQSGTNGGGVENPGRVDAVGARTTRP